MQVTFTQTFHSINLMDHDLSFLELIICNLKLLCSSLLIIFLLRLTEFFLLMIGKLFLVYNV